ncbi:hypothetical protein DL767_003962 [Monosporascus sp. MG133]|nr:hypothetical protein DL767_003962 [Monosporascus sp. MG133]
MAIRMWNNSNYGPRPLQEDRSWSPVQDYIEYEINQEHATDHNKHSKYSGPPTTEQDAAWGALIKLLKSFAAEESHWII